MIMIEGRNIIAVGIVVTKISADEFGMEIPQNLLKKSYEEIWF